MAGGRVPSERWMRIEALFSAAADLAPEDRETYLKDTCPDDPCLQEEVLSLLRYDSTDESTAEPPLLDAISAGAASVVRDEFTGRMMGPYRIEREIGRGGTAVVFLAVRADGEFQKCVAIKLIKRGMDTAAVVERLRRERRILAALEHVSIARLLDGGTTSDGRPWIAMEYVEGLPIDRYCEQNGLDIEARCRLAAKVCDAVAYAHRNLVIHRDLKPSNILITSDGNPKLLDFGIAKLLTEDQSGDEPLTRGPARPLTPEYASPEQLAGAPVGTATDIYSFGVVLFQLLAGKRPPRPTESAPPPKASAAALESGKGARWARQLTGDLDIILQNALRREPERRYLTVGQLQSDLERHVAGLPVSARSETWSYRFGKFLHRHPVGAPAAAAVAFAAVAGVAFIAHAERDAQEQRRKAEQRLGLLVELANRALLDVHGSIERLPGATAARLEIVRTTLEYLDRLNAESGNDARVLSAMASAYTRVARVQGSPLQPNLGDLKGADASYQKAARTLGALLQKDPNNSGLLFRDADLRIEYGILQAETGHKDAAVAEYRHGLEQTARIKAGDSNYLPARKTAARLHLEISQIQRVNDPSGTRKEDLALMPEMEALARENPEDTDCLLDLASLWSQIGLTYDQERKLSDSAASYRNSTAIRERIFAAHPQDVSVQHDLLIAYGHLGDVTGGPMFPNLGDYRGALVWYRKAVDIARRMAEADPSNVQARNDEGTALSRIGISQDAAGQHAAALETLQSASAILEPLLATSPTSLSLVQRLSYVYEGRGRAYGGLGQQTAAVESLRRAIAMCRSTPAAKGDLACQRTIWIGQELLAPLLAEMGDLEGARKEIDGAMAGMKEREAEARRLGHIGLVLQTNASVYAIVARRVSGRERIENWRQAEDWYRRSLAEWRDFHPDTEPFLGHLKQAQAGLAECERALKGL